MTDLLRMELVLLLHSAIFHMCLQEFFMCLFLINFILFPVVIIINVLILI